MGEKAVITSNWTDVCSPIANEHTSVTTVSRSTLLPNVVLVAQSPLHLNKFSKYLANHPDQAWCSKLLHGIERGVNIGFQGERMSIVSGNWKSALDHPEVIMEYLANEVAAGHKAGLFTQPPFSDFVRLPMGIVAKKHLFPVKYRIIHDLSWPPQDSVNDHINPDAFRCFYGSFDEAVALVVKHGVGALSARLDLANAFKHILIRSQDWPLFGSSWDLQHPDASMCCLYYMDLFLPFGLPQPCSTNMQMPSNMPWKQMMCKTCYTLWMITLLLAHHIPWSVPTTSQPWLLSARSFSLPLMWIRSQNQLQPQTSWGWTLTQLPWRPESIPPANLKPSLYSWASQAVNLPPNGLSYPS